MFFSGKSGFRTRKPSQKFMFLVAFYKQSVFYAVLEGRSRAPCFEDFSVWRSFYGVSNIKFGTSELEHSKFYHSNFSPWVERCWWKPRWKNAKRQFLERHGLSNWQTSKLVALFGTFGIRSFAISNSTKSLFKNVPQK